MAFERDGEEEDMFHRLKGPRRHKCWNQAYCFICPLNETDLKGFTRKEGNYYEHFRIHHREALDLHGIATTANKNADRKKIMAIIRAHCKERADNPHIMDWPED